MSYFGEDTNAEPLVPIGVKVPKSMRVELERIARAERKDLSFLVRHAIGLLFADYARKTKVKPVVKRK
jgi:hypothetical protein